MPRDLEGLSPFGEGDTIRVVVESPRGAGVKLRYDAKLGAITFSRALPMGVVYPYDWGFVPGTLAPDGDPLDAMVVLDVGTWPGVVLGCRPLGLVKVEQNAKKPGTRERNDRVLFAPEDVERVSEESVFELGKRVRRELERFFVSATFFAGKDIRFLGWEGPDEARALVGRCRKAYLARRRRRQPSR